MKYVKMYCPLLCQLNSIVLLQIRDVCARDLTVLRTDTERKRHSLTALRIEVSEGPTVSVINTETKESAGCRNLKALGCSDHRIVRVLLGALWLQTENT